MIIMPIKIISKDLKKEDTESIESSINAYLGHHDGEILNISVDEGKVYFFIQE